MTQRGETENKWERPAGCCDCCGNIEICNDGKGLCDESDASYRRRSVNPKCQNDCIPCDQVVNPRCDTPGFVRMSRTEYVFKII